MTLDNSRGVHQTYSYTKELYVCTRETYSYTHTQYQIKGSGIRETTKSSHVQKRRIPLQKRRIPLQKSPLCIHKRHIMTQAHKTRQRASATKASIYNRDIFIFKRAPMHRGYKRALTVYRRDVALHTIPPDKEP